MIAIELISVKLQTNRLGGKLEAKGAREREK